MLISLLYVWAGESRGSSSSGPPRAPIRPANHLSPSFPLHLLILPPPPPPLSLTRLPDLSHTTHPHLPGTASGLHLLKDLAQLAPQLVRLLPAHGFPTLLHPPPQPLQLLARLSRSHLPFQTSSIRLFSSPPISTHPTNLRCIPIRLSLIRHRHRPSANPASSISASSFSPSVSPGVLPLHQPLPSSTKPIRSLWTSLQGFQGT
jgi:hypothetical protein